MWQKYITQRKDSKSLVILSKTTFKKIFQTCKIPNRPSKMLRTFYRNIPKYNIGLRFSTAKLNESADQQNFANEENNATKENEKYLDNFTKEFLKNRIELSGFQKVILSMGSSIAALLDPSRNDMISCLGETTGTIALQNLLDIMKKNEEGQQILIDKPRINTNTVDLNKLRQLPENSFGRAYVQFLDDNKVSPDSRMGVRFIDNPELAYVMTRYRECHDLVHTILGMPTNMLGEVTVKWVEALNTGLPMCYGAAIFGAIRLRPKQRQKYSAYYLPWAIANGEKTNPLISVYWEKRWQQDVTELRKELNITILDLKD